MIPLKLVFLLSCRFLVLYLSMRHGNVLFNVNFLINLFFYNQINKFNEWYALWRMPYIYDGSAHKMCLTINVKIIFVVVAAFFIIHCYLVRRIRVMRCISNVDNRNWCSTLNDNNGSQMATSLWKHQILLLDTVLSMGSPWLFLSIEVSIVNRFYLHWPFTL